MLYACSIVNTWIGETLDHVGFTLVTKETKWTLALVVVKTVVACPSIETRAGLTLICLVLTVMSLKSCWTCTREIT